MNVYEETHTLSGQTAVQCDRCAVSTRCLLDSVQLISVLELTVILSRRSVCSRLTCGQLIVTAPPTFLDTTRATLKTTCPTILPLLHVYSLPR
jgi:hypothetical protein